MADEGVQRRLAAILAADVAGYSRLMGRDEEGTLSALIAHRTELIEPCIAEFRGRLVKTTGDGLLALTRAGNDPSALSSDAGQRVVDALRRVGLFE